MEKIEIKNFAGIKDIKIEVKQINVLIGSQASGKSIIAKLLYFFKNFVFEIIDAAKELKSQENLEQDYLKKFKTYFNSSFWINDNFILEYTIENNYIQISRKDSTSLLLTYSDFYKKLFQELQRNISIEKAKIEQESLTGIHEQNKFLSRLNHQIIDISFEKISNKLKRSSTFSQLYIPAGRSFFANIKKRIFTLLSNNNSFDPFLTEFGEFYENSKFFGFTIARVGGISEQKLQKERLLRNQIQDLNNKILCGKYIRKNGEDFLKIDNKIELDILSSSSGQQETLPLTIILEKMALANLSMGGDSIYIEEPEAHVFPSTQKNIVELISTVYNARKDSLQFFITTHSPYILTSFNNLLQAGILSIDATEEKIAEISRHVPKSRFLKPEEVSVYSLEDGYCKSIIDEETGLIDTNIIDEVSNELAIQFDELLELEE